MTTSVRFFSVGIFMTNFYVFWGCTKFWLMKATVEVGKEVLTKANSVKQS